MIIKTSLHLHVFGDKKDGIKNAVFAAIDFARKHNFKALAVTAHEKYEYKKSYAEYAAQKNILLIPGIEALIEGKDVIVLNCGKDVEFLKTFEDLRRYKKDNPKIFVLAPHPFVFSKKSLGEKMEQNIDLFDAVELSVFSNKVFDFNKKAVVAAKKFGKPVVATSDAHFFRDLNRAYVLVESERMDFESVADAIKKGRFKNEMRNMGLFAMLRFRVAGFLMKMAAVLKFKFKNINQS